MATTQRHSRTTTTKRATVRKKAAAPFELKTATETEFDEREPLFSIDGKEYTCLVRVPTSVALEYLMTTVEDGEGAGIVFALNYALGPVSRRALMTHKGLTTEQLQGIVTIVRAKFDGALKDPKGKPSSD